MHGFEEKVREALEREKMRHVGHVEAEPLSLDAVVAAGVEELQEEAAAETSSLEPAVDAVVACIKGLEEVPEQETKLEEEASLDTAELHVPTALMKLRQHQRTWTAVFQDLFSDRLVELPRQDITIIALEGAATGAAIVTIIATIIFRQA